jgi:SAM-dependent methyltransferase
MTQYQTFPGVKGASESVPKLRSLRLPSLQGKRFLDVGCNEGFFCGYAKFDGAADVVGIDRSKVAVGRARARFPDCQFLVQSWEKLPEGKFDVILLASALHYADDQEALIHRLMDALTDDGTLVLEIGIAPAARSEWVSVSRSIDERVFPSRGKIAEMLESYAWKIIGHSVQQAGDPLARYVVHVRRRKPFVFLLLETPASGKTTLGRTLFGQAKLPVVSGDHTYLRISQGQVPASERLASCISTDFSPQYDLIAERVLAQGLVHDLVEVWCRQGGGGEFALDSYVPEKYQQQVRDAFFDRGYIPVALNWDMQKSMARVGDAAKKASRYVETLDNQATRPTSLTMQIARVKSPALARLISGWHLDRPVDGQIVSDEEQFTVSGWALPCDLAGAELQCYVRTATGTDRFKLDQRRPDVIKSRYKDQSEVPERVFYCGFRFTRQRSEVASGMEFGFAANGEEIPAARLGFAVPVSGKPSLSRSLLAKVGATLRRPK